MDLNKVKILDDKYTAHTYTRSNILFTHGHGATIFDENEKSYIDFTSGIGVNSFGFSDKIMIDSVASQLEKFQHVSNLYYNAPAAQLSQLLCTKTNMDKVFFSNSGAEANECAIKYARKYSFDNYGKNRFKIITLENSFHGRTITTLAATGQDELHKYFKPLTDGFEYCEANNISMLDNMIDNSVCAIMFEIIQGEGGVCCLNSDFISEMDKIAKENDILLIADEVQCGNGRTGKYFAYMHFGFKPDIVTTAKGIAGGLPMGATLFSEKLSSVITPHSHGSTFGANPAIAAGALSIVSRIDDEFMSAVSEKGIYIREFIKNLKNVEEVSGIGMMLGVRASKPSDQIRNECEKMGLLTLTAKDKLRLLPPLNITYEEIDKGLNILKEVIEK